jgi:hypothetical protein
MKMKSLLYFVAFFVGSFSSLSLSTALETPPEWKYKKISTAHFDIIYNSAQQELGELYAKQIEKAYSLLSPVFTSQPEKTLIIINDKTDATNGYATRIPYPHIVTYPVLPGPQESLGESGDWSLELLAHEYTHILNFEPATGVFSLIRGVLGSIAAPNILLPSWWKEGLAVQTESMLGVKGGRLKSKYQDAVLRAMSDDQSLFFYDIAQVNEFIPTWPEGMRPYVFGSVFWSQAVQDYGSGIMNQLNQRHSSRIPYFIEAPAEDLLKDNYTGFYNKAIQETHRRAQEQIKILRTASTSEIHSLPIEAKYSTSPAISDDGKYLALITVDYKSDRVIDMYERDPETKLITKKLKLEIKKEQEPLVPKNNEDGPPSGSIQKISWFHKSPKLIYDQLKYYNRIERYSELNIYDLNTLESKKLTTGLRGREPSVGPNDDKVTFVKLEGGRTALGLYDLANEKSEILFQPAMQERISSPLFLDENTLIFALRNSNGEEGLWTYSLKDKTRTQVLTSFEQARFPVLTKRGLMFTASNNGVHNLYLAASDLKSAKPMTHVTTMVASAALDPESEHLYVTYIGSAGPSVVRIAKDNWEKTPQQLPKINGLFADRYAQLLSPIHGPATEAQSATADAKFEVSDYKPTEYLWPRYWIPYVWTSPEGGMVIQAQTSGFDPLKKHSYDLLVDWNTFLEAFDWSASYLNNTTNLPVQFSAAQTHSYLVNRENLVKDSIASVTALPDIWSFSENLTANYGWRYIERTYFTAPTKRTGPFLGLIYKNFTQGGEQFTPQEGGGAYFNAIHYVQGQDLMSHSQFLAGGVYYFSQFLPKLHAVMIRASAIHTPEEISPIYGAQSDSMDFFGKDLSSLFLARGYLTGQFIGRNMYNANLEYRFPVKDMYQGKGTYAIFMRRLYAAITADALSTDGKAYDPIGKIYNDVTASEVFGSYGIEAHLETTLGYEFPLNFVLGLYKGTDKKYAPQTTMGLAIQFKGF